MNRRILSLLFVLSACGTTVAAPEADPASTERRQLATMSLEAPASVRPGGIATVRVRTTHADGQMVWFLVGSTSSSPLCLPGAAPRCLDIGAPVRTLGAAVARRGAAELTVDVSEVVVPGAEFRVQALIYGALPNNRALLSNPAVVHVEAPVLGCTDPLSFNFDPDATVDDGGCVAVDYGCTVDEAFNFDPLANVDDGSCWFPI